MADRVRRCQNDHRAARSAHPSLRHRRDRQRELAVQESKLSTVTTGAKGDVVLGRSEEHTSELQSLIRISYAVFCLKKKIAQTPTHPLNILILMMIEKTNT